VRFLNEHYCVPCPFIGEVWFLFSLLLLLMILMMTTTGFLGGGERERGQGLIFELRIL
jgi:hypothetical protein